MHNVFGAFALVSFWFHLIPTGRGEPVGQSVMIFSSNAIFAETYKLFSYYLSFLQIDISHFLV